MVAQYMQRLQTWLRSHGEIVGLIGLLSGAFLGLGIPLWQTYWIDTPRLNVEMYSIDRQVHTDARISFDDDELKVLANRPFLLRPDEPRETNTRLTSKTEGVGYTQIEADSILARAKEERNALPDRVRERERELRDVESLTVEKINMRDVWRLNAPLFSEIEVDQKIFSTSTPEGVAERQSAIDQFTNEYRKRHEIVLARYNELQNKLPIAERRLADKKKEMENQKSFFYITAVFSNSGRKSISIRQSALCRVYIGKGNYVDLRLTLKEVKESAEISPNGTRIASFSSDLMDSFPPDDKLLISNHWGQSVHAILFVEDISGIIHNSNRIAFAKGAYQKATFDRLTAEASKILYQTRDF